MGLVQLRLAGLATKKLNGLGPRFEDTLAPGGIGRRPENLAPHPAAHRSCMRTHRGVRVMANNNIGPIGRVAPDWIAFTDVPYWIEQRFGDRLTERSMQDLFSIIRRDTRNDPFRIPDTGTVRYRVKGLTASNVRSRGSVSVYGTIQDPPGLRFSSHGPNSVAVASWDDAKFDPETFTVQGLYSFSAGQRERHAIEVCWVDVERWFQRQSHLSGSARDWGSASVHIDVSSIVRSATSREIDDQPGRAAGEPSQPEIDTSSTPSPDTTPQKPNSLVTSLAVAETKTRNWLVTKMTENPNKPEKNADLLKAAKEWGASERAFKRAKSDAITTTGATAWRQAGRKSEQ